MVKLTNTDMEAIKIHYTNYIKTVMVRCSADDLPVSEVTRSVVEVGMFIAYLEEVTKNESKSE